MPNFYYISFKYESGKLSIKNFSDIKPLKDPHFSFDLKEIEFMLTGQWDMWVDITLKDDKLVCVKKEVNCNIAVDNDYPEMYILLAEYCAPNEPDHLLLPKIYAMEDEYWKRQPRE